MPSAATSFATTAHPAKAPHHAMAPEAKSTGVMARDAEAPESKALEAILLLLGLLMLLLLLLQVCCKADVRLLRGGGTNVMCAVYASSTIW